MSRAIRITRVFAMLENLKAKNIIKLIFLFFIFIIIAHWIGCVYYILLDIENIRNSIKENERNYCIIKNKLGIIDLRQECKLFYSLYQGVIIIMLEDNRPENHLQSLMMIIFLIFCQFIFSVIFAFISSYIESKDVLHELYYKKITYLQIYLIKII